MIIDVWGLLYDKQYVLIGVPNTSENIYNNLTMGSVVPLNYGYTLTVASNISDSTIVTVTGPTFAISVTIEVSQYKMFDLPVEGGKFELYIGVFNSCKTTNKR